MRPYLLQSTICLASSVMGMRLILSEKRLDDEHLADADSEEPESMFRDTHLPHG
jgi:hypothetical protein